MAWNEALWRHVGKERGEKARECWEANMAIGRGESEVLIGFISGRAGDSKAEEKRAKAGRGSMWEIRWARGGDVQQSKVLLQIA